MDGNDPRSLADLISALTSDLAKLVRKESELVRTEFSEKLHMTARALGGVAAGGVLLIGALLVVLQALVLVLSKVMDPIWASLIVAVLVGLGGYLLVRAGMKAMQPANLVPGRAGRQLQKDANLIKEQVK